MTRSCWMTGGRGGTREARAIGAWLAERSRGLPTAYVPEALAAARSELAQDVEQITRHLPPLAGDVLEEIATAQGAFLAGAGPLFRSREATGRVALHPGAPIRLRELVVSPDGAVEIRREAGGGWRARDVAVDAASLALDLTLEVRADLAEGMLSAFAGNADDFELYQVIDYHERQCALGRAAEIARTQASAGADAARRWLLLGLATRRRPLLPPTLIAVGGQVASGKSTIASWLAGRLGVPRIEADRARAFLSRDGEAGGLKAGDAVAYREMLRRAEMVLSSGRPVVLDSCFPRGSQRGLARRLAADRGWPFVFIECRVDRETARARLAERDARSASGGWLRIHRDLERRWEPVEELSPGEHVVLDCARPLPESQARLEALLMDPSAEHRLP